MKPKLGTTGVAFGLIVVVHVRAWPRQATSPGFLLLSAAAAVSSYTGWPATTIDTP